jgi:dolichol-phosphate mannosyltransferase
VSRSDQTKVSVVLPTYNEAGNIVPLVNSILKILPQEYEPEIIVVDDDSPDGTCEIVTREFAGDGRVVPVRRTTDPGLAKAIRAGIELSTGDKIVVMDTDFTHDPAEIPRLLHVAKLYDLVSGSRFCAGGAMQDTGHYLASLLYNWMLRVILRTQVQDNLGGYFVVDRRVLFELPFDDIFEGYGEYYFRLLYFFLGRDFRLVEIPSHYQVRMSGSSKSVFAKMLFTYVGAALKLRLKHRRTRSTAGPDSIPTR